MTQLYCSYIHILARVVETQCVNMNTIVFTMVFVELQIPR